MIKFIIIFLASIYINNSIIYQQNQQLQQFNNNNNDHQNDQFDYKEFMKIGGQRIPPQYRKFNSTIIEEVIENVKSQLKDQQLAQMFEQCFPNTLDSTVNHFDGTEGSEDTFVITGDINAMWQRDSTNQVFPYIKFASKDDHLSKMILGLINRQIKNVNTDPYANAYNYKENISPQDSDITTKLNEDGEQVNAMTLKLWERKWEVDSLAAVLKLTTEYEQVTSNDTFINYEYIEALQNILKTLKEQYKGMRDQNKENKVTYTFKRQTMEPTDTTSHGRGPQAQTCGMIRSAFRPSDDGVTFPYNIPQNAMLSTYLQKTINMLEKWLQKDNQNPILVNKIKQIIAESNLLVQQIQNGIQNYGITTDLNGNKVYAYEVDGFGNHLKMDDANIPSLLSLPFLGFTDSQDEIYLNTRNLILSEHTNPYYFNGSAGEGIGGPHIGDQYIWPMSIIVRGLTSNDDDEILQCLKILKTTTDNTGYMHESFFQDNASNYTRPWFAWANTLFGELILQILEQKPYLLTQ